MPTSGFHMTKQQDNNKVKKAEMTRHTTKPTVQWKCTMRRKNTQTQALCNLHSSNTNHTNTATPRRRQTHPPKQPRHTKQPISTHSITHRAAHCNTLKEREIIHTISHKTLQQNQPHSTPSRIGNIRQGDTKDVKMENRLLIQAQQTQTENLLETAPAVP